jgi:hypothetical protein
VESAIQVQLRIFGMTFQHFGATLAGLFGASSLHFGATLTGFGATRRATGTASAVSFQQV